MAASSFNHDVKTRRTSDISEVISKHLDCPICYDTYNDGNPAKALPCQHTFCLNCINRLVQKKHIECPHCKQMHKVPKKGCQEFKTSYQIMSLVDDFQNIKCEPDVVPPDTMAASTLCNVAINQMGKLYNEVKDIRNRVESAYDKALEEVDKSCGKVKDDIRSQLREIEALIHQEADNQAAIESMKIISRKEEATRGISKIAAECERKLNELQTSRRLPEDTWSEFNEEWVTLKDTVSNISQNCHEMQYKILSIPERNPPVVTDDFYKFKELDKLLVVDYSDEDGCNIKPIPVKRHAQLRRNQTRRSRKDDRESVLIKSHSADEPNYTARIVLEGRPQSAIIQDRPCSPPIIQDRPRTLPRIQDHPHSPSATQGHPSSPTVKNRPSAPPGIHTTSSTVETTEEANDDDVFTPNIGDFQFRGSSPRSSLRAPPPLPQRRHTSRSSPHESRP